MSRRFRLEPPTGGSRIAVLALTLLSAACGGPPHGASRSDDAITRAVEDAVREEATGSATEAERRFAAVVEQAVGSAEPLALAAVTASLDALVTRDVAAMTLFDAGGAIEERLPEDRERAAVRARLERAATGAASPFGPSLVHEALTRLAERRGDARSAAESRRVSGCAREVTTFGVVDALAVSGVLEPTALAAPGAVLPARMIGRQPVAPPLEVRRATADGCTIRLGAISAHPGVRDLVLDVRVPPSGIVALRLATDAPAVVRAGGAEVLRRELGEGNAKVTELGTVHASAGWLRVVIRAGMGAAGQSVALFVTDDRGRPLEARAPAAGTTALARATAQRHEPLVSVDASGRRRALAILAALATGHTRRAERLARMAPGASGEDLVLALARLRALRAIDDLPPERAAELARPVAEGLVTRWPAAWEAALEHAELVAERKSADTARFEEVAELDRALAAAEITSPGLVAAQLAALAATAGLEDYALRARAIADRSLDGSRHARRAALVGARLDGSTRVARECAVDRTRDFASVSCHAALVAAGAPASKERERLRALVTSPSLLAAQDLAELAERGDRAGARRALAALPAGERSLSLVLTAEPDATPARIDDAATTASDAHRVLPQTVARTHPWLVADLDEEVSRVIDAERKRPSFRDSGTVILTRRERYDLSPSGVLRYVILDLRRVTGTTDIDQNTQVALPQIQGGHGYRNLRVRVFKKDGRVIDPDQPPSAAQMAADIAHVEPGDVVEHLTAGVGIARSGEIALDSPDLLGDRTSVREASVELRLPRHLPLRVWGHRLLGKAETHETSTAVHHTFRLRDATTRTVDPSAPRSERDVSVAVSTLDWASFGARARELAQSLESTAPEIEELARDAARGKATKRAALEAVVREVGRRIRDASPQAVSDRDGFRFDGPQTETARTMLVNHEGSRSWVILAALRALSIDGDLVMAEESALDADPTFPPHMGRFVHPLLRVRLPAEGGQAAQSVWVDADVRGAPLAPGQLSPQLRGRFALAVASGTIEALPRDVDFASRDEVDLRLALDEAGDAHGTLTLLLRGNAARHLSAALGRIVGDERSTKLRSIALAWVPNATVEDVALSSGEDSWEIALRAALTVSGYAEPVGRGDARAWTLPGIAPVHFVFPGAYVAPLSSWLTQRADRSSALTIDVPLGYHFHRRVTLPPGAVVTRAPGPLAEQAFFTATRAIRVGPEAVEDEFVLDVPTSSVPPERYAELLERTRATDAAFLATTRVAPPTTKRAAPRAPAP